MSISFIYDFHRSESKPFGSNWCGPKNCEHGKETLVAKYHKEEGGDGHDVEVYCRSYPATFYTIKAVAGSNSAGEPRPGFSLQTGSGMHDLAAAIAEAIADGMLGLKTQ